MSTCYSDKIKAKIERYCKNHPEFVRKVLEELSRLEAKKAKNKDSNNVAASGNIEDETETENVGAALLTKSASCSLHDSVILDSGTNVHIINNAMSHRIIESREATSKDKVHSGQSMIQATAVVSAEVHLKCGEKSKILTLHDALYIPDYMSNLV
ncbi:hypothetical protein K3495_g4908 [Podosphaera aphanis]|nr:hypothetical protein K3495_g4908 [Podosphaera aphanis]